MNVTGLINLGIILFAFVVVFQLVTLPVEFDASRRALAFISADPRVGEQQARGARQMLTAAALTYVARCPHLDPAAALPAAAAPRRVGTASHGMEPHGHGPRREGRARACAPSDSPDGEGAPRALSVSEAMGFAKGALESRTLVVEGEVSEFNDKPGYKAAYFTIADASSPMSCMMWRNRYLASGVELRVGEKVRVTGALHGVRPQGRMQFEVFSLAPAGEGDLRQRVDRLARKLEAQGLMDPRAQAADPAVLPARGRGDLPARQGRPRRDAARCGGATRSSSSSSAASPWRGPTPRRTSSRACASRRRLGPTPSCSFAAAAPTRTSCPSTTSSWRAPWPPAPCRSVTGIGHEPDTTICDMVGDLRCSTPTAAAESVAPSCEELSSQLRVLGTRLGSALHKDLGPARAGARRARVAPGARPARAHARPAPC